MENSCGPQNEIIDIVDLKKEKILYDRDLAYQQNQQMNESSQIEDQNIPNQLFQDYNSEQSSQEIRKGGLFRKNLSALKLRTVQKNLNIYHEHQNIENNLMQFGKIDNQFLQLKQPHDQIETNLQKKSRIFSAKQSPIQSKQNYNSEQRLPPINNQSQSIYQSQSVKNLPPLKYKSSIYHRSQQIDLLNDSKYPFKSDSTLYQQILLNQKQIYKGLGRTARPPVFAFKNSEDPSESPALKLMAVTWNMAGNMPSFLDFDQLIRKDQIEHDIYAIGTQEAQRAIATSMFLHGKEKLNKFITDYFDNQLVEQKLVKNDQDQIERQFTMIHSVALGATHLVIFVKKSLVPYVHEVKSDQLACGIGNVLGNKGAVSISFNLGQLRLLFLNCHLEAHTEAQDIRTEQWNKINDHFILKKNQISEVKTDISQNVLLRVPSSPIQSIPNKIEFVMPKRKSFIQKLGCFDNGQPDNQKMKILEQKQSLSIQSNTQSLFGTPMEHWDSVIWTGDFNYRIQAQHARIVKLLIENEQWEVLQANDQFFIEKQINRIDSEFQEGEITFAPTFKIRPQDPLPQYLINEMMAEADNPIPVINEMLHLSNKQQLIPEYNIGKRQPSWTDRIIFRSNKLQLSSEKDIGNNNDYILTQVNYDANTLVRLSDHRPVFAQFLLKFDPKEKNNRNLKARQREKAREILVRKKGRPPVVRKLNQINQIMPMNEPTQINLENARGQLQSLNQEDEFRQSTMNMTETQEMIEAMCKQTGSNFGHQQSKACDIF